MVPISVIAKVHGNQRTAQGHAGRVPVKVQFVCELHCTVKIVPEGHAQTSMVNAISGPSCYSAR